MDETIQQEQEYIKILPLHVYIIKCVFSYMNISIILDNRQHKSSKTSFRISNSLAYKVYGD